MAYSTSDGGQTWNSQYLGYGTYGNYDYVCPWRYAIYDNDNASFVYMAGGSHDGYMKLMCSTDGGITWNRPYMDYGGHFRNCSPAPLVPHSRH